MAKDLDAPEPGYSSRHYVPSPHLTAADFSKTNEQRRSRRDAPLSDQRDQRVSDNRSNRPPFRQRESSRGPANRDRDRDREPARQPDNRRERVYVNANEQQYMPTPSTFSASYHPDTTLPCPCPSATSLCIRSYSRPSQAMAGIIVCPPLFSRPDFREKCHRLRAVLALYVAFKVFVVDSFSSSCLFFFALFFVFCSSIRRIAFSYHFFHPFSLPALQGIGHHHHMHAHVIATMDRHNKKANSHRLQQHPQVEETGRGRGLRVSIHQVHPPP
ncbi:hypothetical protein CPB84DRAFT_363195 [Gymnopilus junonius]|uniref:Uncharacterized protein n=1 Tax=Gymnopilus junonius TaxID=109634 RepID=A0A9P5TQ61_GYMJU|nr:hypothetical protein CPB84DRAFT_363195 [Gymnopilus junonius]